MGEFLTFKSISFLSRVLPRHAQYALSHAIADIRFRVNRSAREQLTANMRMVLGDKVPDATVNHEARWVFRSFGMNICEFFGTHRFDGRFADRHVQVVGVEHLDRALAQGKGALFTSAHYANWELGASKLARMGYPMLVVAQPQGSERTNNIFVHARESRGVDVVSTTQGALAALRALKANRPIAMLADRATGGPTVPVTLLGRKADLPQGPWRLALETGAALLPSFMSRKPSYDHVLQIHPALKALDHGSRIARMKRMAQAWADLFGAQLQADPSQWMAFYPVWTPEGRPEALPAAELEAAPVARDLENIQA